MRSVRKVLNFDFTKKFKIPGIILVKVMSREISAGYV